MTRQDMQRATSGVRHGVSAVAPRAYEFPRGFLWGAATSSHQVEGGNRWNDWWAFEQAGRVPHASGEACRHYELYEHDFDLARAAGQNAHRFSIEWSRVEPNEGEWNADAIDHYRDVIAALRRRGLEPVVTLHHFTLPTWAAERGGWTSRHIVRWFARYADHVARELGEGIRYWVTVNEPTVYVKHAYALGDWPPGRKGAWGRVLLVLANLARAHRIARARVRARRPATLVGFAHSAPVLQPCDPSRLGDRAATWFRDVVLNRAFFRLMGAGVPGVRVPFDFVGLNYYTRAVVRGTRSGIVPFAGTECLSEHHVDRGPRNDVGWEVYPAGLLQTLRRFASYGVPLIVTENGIATADEDLRATFLLEHLVQLAQALGEGIDVRGYFYWSLIDNFEWAAGTTARFGLFAVDYSTFERSARPALHLYRDVCRTNRLPLDEPADVRAEPCGSSSR